MNDDMAYTIKFFAQKYLIVESYINIHMPRYHLYEVMMQHMDVDMAFITAFLG